MPFTSQNQITIERTPRYLVVDYVPGLIYKMNPNIKLILLLRNPTKRAISD